MTKKELSQLYKLSGEIRILQNQLEKVIADAEKTTAILSDMPQASGTRDRVGEITAIIIDIKTEIQDRIDKYWRQYNVLLNYIKSVSDPIVRQALTLKYVEGMKWEEVVKKSGGKNTSESIKKMVYRYLKRN